MRKENNTMPKYEEQLAFTVIVSNSGKPDREFKVYSNGAIDGFPSGDNVSISNKIPVFIHEAHTHGYNIGRESMRLDFAEFCHNQKIGG